MFMDNDSKVVSIDAWRKAQPPKQIKELENIFNASDIVLDALCDEFDEGIAVGLLNGQIQVSATFDDYDLLVELLETALDTVKNEY